ncbi:hypothetical protein SEA_ANTUNA_61 [Microbacterium phage Antuna]|nr:hypothetical protein SEA_ANTUNA_61 [Microbacterium phage Antuna]
MIFDRYLGATGVLSMRFVDVPGYVDALAKHMAEAIVAEAEQHGMPVVADDVVLYRAGEDAQTMTVEFGAVWAPSPMTHGIEFYGGSHDGEVMTQIEPDDGPGGAFPPRSIRVMSEPPTSFDFEPLPDLPDSRVLVEDYERAGIDPLKRRFIYKIKVTK